MKNQKATKKLKVTQQLLSTLQNGIGFELTTDQLTDIAEGDGLPASSYVISGFVHSLSYSPNDQILTSVAIKLPPLRVGIPIHPYLFLEDGPLRSDMVRIENLNDFRNAFETAAKFRMKFSVIHDRNGKIVKFGLNPSPPITLDEDGTPPVRYASMDPLPDHAGQQEAR